MNKYFKRVLSVAMSTAMLASLAMPVTPAMAEEAPTVKMTYITGGTEPEGLDRIEAKLSELTMEKIGCNVELVPVAFADQATKYNMWFANGNDVDIIITVFQDYLSMINAGAFQELDDLLPDHAQALLEKDEVKHFLAAGGYNGYLYGVPTIPKAPGNGGAMYMRKDVYDSLDTSGLDADGDGYYNYEDLDNMFAQIAENFPDLTPFGVSGSVSRSNFFYLQNYDNLGVSGESGGVLVDALNSTTVENLYATDAYYSHLEWMRKWYLDGYISKDAATSSEAADEMFNAGRTAAYIGMSTPGSREDAERDSGVEVVQLDLCPAWMTTNVYTGVLFFISKDSSNPEKAMEFLDILFTDAEISGLLSNGEEGVDYVMSDAENGVGEFLEDRDYINIYGVWGDQTQTYISNVPTPVDEWDAYLQLANDHTSKAYGYKFNATDVDTELSTVKSVISKYLTQLEYGTVDLETVYPEFLDELDKAGINTIIEANQAQLDAYLAQ